MGYYDFPHTRNYDSDLGFLIKKYKELNEDYNTLIQIYEVVRRDIQDITIEELQIMINDGTLETIINEEIFTDLNNKINSIKNLVINVKDFGAKGDGATDDTIAFKNALASLGATDNFTPVGSSGGTLLVPAGNYVITDTLFIPNATQIIGIGTITPINPNNSDYYNGKNGTVIHFNCPDADKACLEYRPYSTNTNQRIALPINEILSSVSNLYRGGSIILKNLSIVNYNINRVNQVGIKLSYAPCSIIDTVSITNFTAGIMLSYSWDCNISNIQASINSQGLIFGTHCSGSSLHHSYINMSNNEQQLLFVAPNDSHSSHPAGIYCYNTPIAVSNCILEHWYRGMYFNLCPQIVLQALHMEDCKTYGIDFYKSIFNLNGFRIQSISAVAIFNFENMKGSSIVTDLYQSPDINDEWNYIRNLYDNATGTPSSVAVIGYTPQSIHDSSSDVVLLMNNPRKTSFVPRLTCDGSTKTQTVCSGAGVQFTYGKFCMASFHIVVDSITQQGNGNLQLTALPGDVPAIEPCFLGTVNVSASKTPLSAPVSIYDAGSSASSFYLCYNNAFERLPSSEYLQPAMQISGSFCYILK